MQSTYLTWRKVCKFHNVPQNEWKLNGQYNYIEFANGSRIDLLDLKFLPSDPLYERFGSLEFTDGAIEEAGEIHFLAYDMLHSRINRHMNKELGIRATLGITGNPKKNWTYQIFYKPWKENKLPENMAFIQSLYMDNPYTADDYGHTLSQMKDEATKQRLMFGNWEYDDDPNKLIEYDAILDLFTNNVAIGGQKYLTGDIARYGGDKIVLWLWEGFKVYKCIVKSKQGLDITTNDIRDELRDEQIPYSHAIIDDDGVGGGPVDFLKIKGFVNNSSALENPETKEKENYKNLKAQCSYMFAKKVNDREIAISAILFICISLFSLNYFLLVCLAKRKV